MFFAPDPDLSVLELDGETLGVDAIVAVARQRRRVALAPAARDRIARCRAMVDTLIASRAKVYGLTTGFGKLRDVDVSPEDARLLQLNLIRSHACGSGRPFPEDVVRAAILLRINTFCRGNSGIRLWAVEQLVGMLNEDVYPLVPEKGSVGASGDLSPLSHVILALMGDAGARIYPRRSRRGAAPVHEARSEEFLAIGPETRAEEGWSWSYVDLEAKEGLALNNGTQFMTAVGCLVAWDASFTLRLGELAAAMSLEAQGGVRAAFDARVHRARPQRHQGEVAERIRRYTEGSTILDMHLNSAAVQTARLRLADAQAELGRLADRLRGDAVQPPVSVHALGRDLERLRERLAAIVPGPEDPRLELWRRAPPREQLRLIRDHFLRVRHEVAAINQGLQSVTFPEGEETARAQSAVAAALGRLAQATPDSPKVQDDYSYRCFPQVMGTAWRALEHVLEILEAEANSSTDNPLLFPPDPGEPPLEAWAPEAYAAWLAEHRELCLGAVLGGGNFHGEPVAVAMDYLKIALAEAGNIAERRVAHLVDENLSGGLPGFLTTTGGVSSGLMIPQYTAAALVSENKVLCHPASVDSIPTSANSEDHVSMGTIAARKAAEVLDNVQTVIAIELLTAAHALSFRAPLQAGARVREAAALLGPPIAEDRVFAHDFVRVRALMDGPLRRVLVGA